MEAEIKSHLRMNCDKFEVSRMTIRQAINNLVEQGYLYRKRGIGTFVQLPKVEQNCKE